MSYLKDRWELFTIITEELILNGHPLSLSRGVTSPSVTAKPCSIIRNHYLSPPLPIIIIIFHQQLPLGRYHSHNHHPPLELGWMMAIQVTELISAPCLPSTLNSGHPFHNALPTIQFNIYFSTSIHI